MGTRRRRERSERSARGLRRGLRPRLAAGCRAAVSGPGSAASRSLRARSGRSFPEASLVEEGPGQPPKLPPKVDTSSRLRAQQGGGEKPT